MTTAPPAALAPAQQVAYVLDAIARVLMGSAPAEQKVDQCRVLAIMGAEYVRAFREEQTR